MSDQPDHEHGGLGKLTSGKFNRGRATIDNENGSHSIVITSSSDLTTTDDPGPSSGMRDKNSTTAGFVTAGDGATTIVNNPNVIVAGSNGKHEKEVIPYLIPPEPQHHASQHMTLRLDHHAGYPNIFVNPGAQLNIYSDQPKSTSEENQIKTILKTIHNITWMKTSTSIGETFKRDRFSEPDFEVHPQIVESPNFYQGGHQVKGAHTSNESGRRKNKVEVREAEYKKGSELALQMPSSSLPSTLPNPLPMQTSLSLLPFHLHRKTKHEIEQQQKRKLKLKNEYKKDTKFTFNAEHDQDSNFISGESLMEKIHEKKDKPGVLGVVAQAGAGKTTCMRRRARYTMEKNGITRENDFTPSENSRFQLILFIEMKSIEFSDDTSLGNFLFQDILEDDDDVKIARKWLNQNQDKCVIFFDGLDQAHQAITDDDMNQCNPASTSSILTKLLTRHLLPGTRIIISSREHSATSLPEEAWFDDVITLTGFTEEDAKKLFNAITAESCDTDDCDISDQNLTNWDKLSKTSSALLTFISVPVILLFTAIVFNLYDAAPSSLTDLMAKVIESLQYTLNTRKRKQIWPIINKLKRLSHEGMEKGLVIFSEGDLTNRYLKIDDVRDLLLMVSRSKSLSRRFIEGDNVFFFCHQILQEFLSACFIVEMSLTKFKDFVQMELNKNHWSIVRRFVCGLIFSKSPNEELVEISDEIEKQKILRENLIHLLNESMDDHVPKHKLAEKLPLELYAAIYESEDDSVIRAIQQINLTAYPGLSQDALRMIGSLIATSRMLESFTVGSGNIKQHLSILTDCMKDFTVQIKMVYVDWQFVKNPPEFAYLDKFLQRVDSDKVVLRRKETPWFDFTDGGADCKRYPELAAQCIVEGVVLDNRTDYDFIKLWLYFGKTAEKYLGVYKRSVNTLLYFVFVYIGFIALLVVEAVLQKPHHPHAALSQQLHPVQCTVVSLTETGVLI